MATIRSQLTLNDGMTTVLKKITVALNATLDTFEMMQRASGQAINAEGIRQGRVALAEATETMEQMERYTRRTADMQDRLNRGFQTGASSADGLLQKVKGIAMAAGGFMAVQKAIDLSDQMTSTTARLSLIVDDGGSVDALEDKIMASAQRSRAGYLDTAAAIASMGANAGNAFSGNDELIAFMEQVNKQFVIGGATAQGQSAAMLQLTQAMAAGALRGEELNSILENAPGIARAIESYMGVAEGSIKSYAQEGKVTAEVVKNALFAAAEDTYDEMGNLIEGTNSKFESMPMTWGQVWTSMQNKALAAFDPILSRLNDIANSDQFETVINGMTTALATVGAVASAVFGTLVNMAGWAIDNWSVLAPIVMGVAAAFLLYNSYLAVTNGLQMIDNIQKGLAAVAAYKAAAANTALAASEQAEAMATAAATAAQYGFNAALLASPITWVLLIIIAVIAALYAVVAAINKVTGSTISATGLICGAVAVAAALIGNLVIGLLNAIIQYVWTIFVEPFLGIVEWILNVCNGGFDSFGGAVANLIGQIISWFLSLGKVVTKIIDAIFGTDWTSGLSALQDSVTAWGKTENAITLDREAPTIDHRFEYGDAWAAGNDFGKGIDEKIGGMFGGFDLGAATDYDSGAYALDTTAMNTGSIADSTGGMADALDVSTEELAYLRDIAERDAINRFTTAEVKIDMTGMTNRIEGGADLDGVLSTLTDGFTEALVTAAEGVHT